MDDILGFIRLSALTFTPRGYAACDGSLLQISHSTALFALLGTQYGGDGTTTFALPNLTKMSPLPGLNYVICVDGIFPSRSD